MKPLLLFLLLPLCQLLQSADTYSYNTRGLASLTPCASGGFIHLTSNHTPTANNRAYVFRTNAADSVLWSIYLPFSIIFAQEIVELADGSFIGTVSSPAQDTLYIFRLTANGNLLWSKNLSYYNSNSLRDLLATPDTCVLLAGGGCFGLNTISKLNKDGQVLWAKSYVPQLNISLLGSSAIVADTDHHAVVAGMYASGSPSTYDIMIYKVSYVDGSLMWFKIHDAGPRDYAHSIIKAPDGGFTIAGQSSYFSIDSDMAMLMHTDSVGNLLWARGYPTDKKTYFQDLDVTESGDYIAAGMLHYNDTYNNEALAVRTNKDGDIIWQKSTGNINIGHFGSQIFYFVRYRGNNQILLNGPLVYGDDFVSMYDSSGMCEATDEDLIAYPFITSSLSPEVNITSPQPFTINSMGTTTKSVEFTRQQVCNTPLVGMEELSGEPFGFSYAPNPFHSSVEVTVYSESDEPLHITVTNLTGQVVYQQYESIAGYGHLTKLHLAQLPSGVYLLQAAQGQSRIVKRLVKE